MDLAVTIPSESHLHAFAARLADAIRPRDCIALHGELGAGKTTLARMLIEALGGTGPVPSPTFTLVQTYDTRKGHVRHFDLYRLKHADELTELGWDEGGQDIMLVEWPERADGHLPKNRLDVVVRIADKAARRITLVPHGDWAQRAPQIVT